MSFPLHRPRRLRRDESIRRLVRETELSASHLIAPIFVREGEKVRKPIASMPGQFQFSVDQAIREAREVQELGVPAVILFGIPDRKDAAGTGASAETGIVQTALREIRRHVKGMVLIADTCLCEYTDHGHCGIVEEKDPDVRNDETLKRLEETAVAQAKAGADFVAPSGMMDGAVRSIRIALERGGLGDVGILAYAAKYASAFYGPFRDAAESPPKFGDRRTYQMDPANAREALREIALDVEEGADVVMVKPALAYLDVIRAARERFDVPIAAYNVSGEYAMVKAAAEKGWLDEKSAALEILTGIRRAGADLILTYWARDAAGWLDEVSG